MATLTAKNLAKAYKGRRVVEDVSLTVNSGEIVGLLGPNGAGKTTTFYMVVGIVPRDAGNIIIDDDDISLLPLHARARRGIGYLPQEASIFRRLSVYDNLMAVLQIRDDLSAEQPLQRSIVFEPSPLLGLPVLKSSIRRLQSYHREQILLPALPVF